MRQVGLDAIRVAQRAEMEARMMQALTDPEKVGIDFETAGHLLMIMRDVVPEEGRRAG